MNRRSEDEQALIKIQHEWAKARVKGDSSYTRRLEAEDCTIVWPNGVIVSKSADLQTMTGSRSSQRKVCLDRHICKTKRPMEGGRIAVNSGLGKVIIGGYG
jgi:hypothetical protein